MQSAQAPSSLCLLATAAHCHFFSVVALQSRCTLNGLLSGALTGSPHSDACPCQPARQKRGAAPLPSRCSLCAELGVSSPPPSPHFVPVCVCARSCDFVRVCVCVCDVMYNKAHCCRLPRSFSPSVYPLSLPPPLHRPCFTLSTVAGQSERRVVSRPPRLPRCAAACDAQRCEEKSAGRAAGGAVQEERVREGGAQSRRSLTECTFSSVGL